MADENPDPGQVARAARLRQEIAQLKRSASRPDAASAPSNAPPSRAPGDAGAANDKAGAAPAGAARTESPHAFVQRRMQELGGPSRPKKGAKQKRPSKGD